MGIATRQTACRAKSMNASEKKQIAFEIIGNKTTVSDAANKNDVSRKFIRQQKNKGITAIDDAFAKDAANDDDKKILFYLPVTKAWLAMVVICLLMYARCSFRNVIKIFSTAFGYDISIGAIHNISNNAIKKATEINDRENLSRVVLGAHDEKFHYHVPILSGTDTRSLYCYLLSQESCRDSATWAINLWDLEKKGFKPERIFADDGSGLRAGHKLVMSEISCDRDHFHIIRDLKDMSRFFRNRFKTAVSYLVTQQNKFDVAKRKGNEHLHINNLQLASDDVKNISALSKTIDILVDWMEHDILNMPGKPPAIRKELYDFIVDEFRKLERIYPHRIKEVRVMLEDRNYLALSFADVLDDKFKSISEEYDCSLEVIWDMCALQRCKMGSYNYAIRSQPLEDKFGDRFDDVEDAVLKAMDSTERTSSMAENLHSRISPYLFLRREVGNGFLNLLRFYLNHTPFVRSDNVHRVNKTPAQILTGKSHPDWLEMLGFKQAA